MRALITGSNGFLGSNLIKYINNIKPDWKIYGFDLDLNHHLDYRYKKINFNSQINWKKIILEFEPDYIFHLIGLFRGSEEEIFTTNVYSFERLLRGIVDSDINSRIIILGSAAQYGIVSKEQNPINENYPTNPISIYGKSKQLQEEIAIKYHKENNLNVVCTRPSSFIGKGVSNQLLSGYISECFRKAKDRVSIEISNASDVRDYVDVRDVCQALVLLQETSNIAGEIFNLSSSTNIFSNLEFIYLFEEISKKEVEITYTNPDKKPLEIFLDNRKLKEKCNFSEKRSIKDSITWCLQ